MKNLSYIDVEYFDWYKKIIASKNDNVVLSTQVFLDQIETRYNEYKSNFSKEELYSISDSIYNKNHPELSGCYKSKTKKVSELLHKIRINQTDEAKSKCQYCGINKPKTIDHYLPISLYPEFAVLAINLIPCCNECNKKKDNYWKADGYRGILNFYVDTLPNEQFLNAEWSTKNDVPVIKYEFDFSTTDFDLSNIIKAHFKRLELFSRYREESADEISEISRQLKIYSNDKSTIEKKKIIKEDSISLKDKYGKNYWKAVLRDALSEYDDFFVKF